MEGYTNIIGSPYDFDDLDIEGRVVDEWKANPEERTSTNLNVPKQVDEKTLLSERVKLDNGQFADVYSSVKKNDTMWYTCRLCSDTMVGLSALRLHKDSSKHRTNMSKPVHPRAKFITLDPKENMDLEPGEPVPPGLEEEIFKSCKIQPKLDAVQHLPLIGLEFMVEITGSTLEDGFYYQCLLCDKNGSERNMIIHFTSIFHYMKYLSIFFPTVARKLHALPNKKLKKSFGLLVTEIVQDIENKFGRMKPHSEPNSNFFAPGRKNELYTSIFEGQHFREMENENFCEKATAENVDKKSQELLNAPPQTGKPIEDSEGAKSLATASMFNKNNRVSVDKKQLRPRNEDSRNRSKSPDVQFVGEEKLSSEKRKRSRSKSLSSISSLSSTSSRPHRYRSRSRTQSRRPSPARSRRNWSRSRSRSPGYRYRRQRSPSYTRGGRHSPGRRYYPHNNSRGRSPDYKHGGTDKYGRSFERDKYERRNDRYPRERYDDREPPRDVPSSEERLKWSKFREEFAKIEEGKREKLKFYEKNPEKHPQYPEEWKTFWNRRYNELQRSGIDPSKHDFKPEWISFWTKRMKELFEEDLLKEKNDLQNKYLLDESGTHSRHNERKRLLSSPGLTDISPPTPERKDAIADIKQTWKALTGSDIKEGPKRPLSPWEEESKTQELHGRKDVKSPSPPSFTDKMLEDMPQRKTRTSSLIFVLRKLTVLEQQLGSLAPKVFEMLSQALALEKVKEDASLDLLFERDNSVYLETVREKLIALLCAGVVPRNFVNTARSAIKHIDISLYLTSKRERSVPVEAVRSVMGLNPCNAPYPSNPYIQTPQPVLESPVVVPGVGQVDKAAIAQQIATALIEQGRTDVGEAELQYLINAVVGMAEASKNSSHPMTTANFLQQIQTQPSTSNEIKPQSQNQVPTPVSSAGSALKLLQSAYNDSSKVEQDSPKPDTAEVPDSKPSIEQELIVALTTVNKLDEEEQQITFIRTIQSSNPEIFKRMCPFLPSNLRDVSNSPKQAKLSNSPKRSPICIPLSKEKSEQKVKPNQTGRLSPFSSRSAGLNPTESESKTTTQTVVLDDDECNNDKRMDSETRKPDNDEDDDDYSYEDIYKAAQEKLQKQIVMNEKNVSTKKQEAGVKLSSTEDQDDDVTFVTEEKAPLNPPLLDKGSFSEKDPFIQTMNIPSNLSSLNTNSRPPQQSFQQGNISNIASYSHLPPRQEVTAPFKEINTTTQDQSQSKIYANEMASAYAASVRHTQANAAFYGNREPSYTVAMDKLRPPQTQTGEMFGYTKKKEDFNIPSLQQMNRDSFGGSANTDMYNSAANRGVSNQYGRAPYSASDRGPDYSTFNPYQNQNAYQMNQYQAGQPRFGNDNFMQTRPTNSSVPTRFTNSPQTNPRYPPTSHYPHY